MGVLSGTQLVYNIENIPMKGVKDAISSIRRTRTNNENTNIESPAVPSPLSADVDCNLVAFLLGGNKYPHLAASKTADFLECLAKYGFVVTPICNGHLWYHSKQATTDRI